MGDHDSRGQADNIANDELLVKAAWIFDQQLSNHNESFADAAAMAGRDLDPASRSRLLEAQTAIEFLINAATGSATSRVSSVAALPDDEIVQMRVDGEPTSAIEEPTVRRDEGDDDAELPKTFGRFEVLRELGRGGLGVVLLARDPVLNREVAVKIPRPEALLTPDLRARFLREAQAAARLTHPNIVAVYEVGLAGAVTYIAAAYCPGTNLARWFEQQDRTISRRQAVAIVIAIADAIEYAHLHGVLHRDLKPSNILLETFESPAAADTDNNLGFIPKVSDFGLARIQDLGSDETRTGLVMGTPAYMAPEQAEGRMPDLGPATDVYGLGTILYELLTGQPAFQGASDADTLRKVVGDEPIAPRNVRPDIPRDLEAVCLKCLHKDTVRRYPTAARLAADLRRVLNGEMTEARPLTAPRRFWKWARRHPAIAATMVVTLLAGLAVGGVSTAYSWRLSDELQLSERLRLDAVTARADAEKHRNDAERERDVNEQYAYAGRMQEAFQAFAQGSALDTDKLIAQYDEGTRQDEMRGFEWYYLRRATHDERLTLLGHEGQVYAVAFSPDGRTLVSGGQDGTIRVWNPMDGQLLHMIRAHDSCTNDLDFSPDGRTLASASCDGTIKLWDTQSWTSERTLIEDKPPILCVAFSPDGRMIAGGGDGHLHIWNANGTLIKDLEAANPLDSVAWSADSKQLSAPIHHGVSVWETTNWTVRTIPAGAPVMSVAFSPDGDMLAYNSDFDVRLLDLGSQATNAPRSGHRGRIQKVLFRPAGREVLSCGDDQTVKIWPLAAADSQGGSADAAESRTLVGHTGRIQDMVLAPDGHTLATASFDGTVRLWDLATRGGTVPMLTCATATQFETFAPPSFSPDLRQLAVTTEDGHVVVWNLAEQQPAVDYDVEGEASSALAFSGDLGTLLGWDYQHELLSLRPLLSSHRLPISLNSVGPVHQATLSAHSSSAAAVSPGGSVHVWNTRTGGLRYTYSPPDLDEEEKTDFGNRARLALSTDGRLLAVMNVPGGGILDLQTGAWAAAEGIDGAFSDMYFSPDDRYLIVNCFSTGVNVVDAHTAKQVRLLRLQSRVTASACSPDGSTIAVATGRRINLWHIETGQRLGTVSVDEETGSIIRVQFSADGRRLGAVTIKPTEGGAGLATAYVW